MRERTRERGSGRVIICTSSTAFQGVTILRIPYIFVCMYVCMYIYHPLSLLRSLSNSMHKAYPARPGHGLSPAWPDRLSYARPGHRVSLARPGRSPARFRSAHSQALPRSVWSQALFARPGQRLSADRPASFPLGPVRSLTLLRSARTMALSPARPAGPGHRHSQARPDQATGTLTLRCHRHSPSARSPPLSARQRSPPLSRLARSGHRLSFARPGHRPSPARSARSAPTHYATTSCDQ